MNKSIEKKYYNKGYQDAEHLYMDRIITFGQKVLDLEEEVNILKCQTPPAKLLLISDGENMIPVKLQDTDEYKALTAYSEELEDLIRKDTDEILEMISTIERIGRDLFSKKYPELAQYVNGAIKSIKEKG